MIRKANINDAAAIAEIYNYYVDKTIITFAEKHITTQEIETQIQEDFPWYVWDEHGKILGYAHASKFKYRCAYKTSVETTVYLNHQSTGKGIGSVLYQTLIDYLDGAGHHALIGEISLSKPASVAIHEKFGYKKVAHFKEVGHKFGKFIDVGYWQRIR